MKISLHTLVKNEERFIWFSVMSVIEYVDKAFIWDTGSVDNTIKIIKEIERRYPKKVIFNDVGDVDVDDFTKVRQRMLDETKADWFIVVDGDEIWWDDSIETIIKTIKEKGEKIESIVVPTVNLVGDLFHYQEKAAGRYRLAGKFGHYNLRAVNRDIPGLKSERAHGTWGWADDKGRMIQDRSRKKTLFMDAPYLHATFLPRSESTVLDRLVPKRRRKLKYELGNSFPPEYYFPEVLFRPRPKVVSCPWRRRNSFYFTRALFQTPLKKIRRRVYYGKTGY